MTDIPLPDTPPQVTLGGIFHEEHQCAYEHVPFEVPESVDQLLIDVGYNDRIDSSPLARSGNTLDIGLFDERGIESRSPGFRGWSGSVQTRIVVGTERATPPYRAGKPGAGTWHMLLGPYKIGQNGLRWEVRIWLNPEIALPDEKHAPDIDSVWRPYLPAPAEPNWYRGDLHVHTVYSDGTATPAEIAVTAVEAGLHFYGITDHNRAQSPVGLVPQGDEWPVLVPGVEVTTYAGHFNVWGTEHWYEFRDPSAEGLQGAVDAALRDGGTVSLNHPKPFGPEWEFPEVTGFHVIEAWNSWWARFNAASLEWWHRQLGSERPLPMVAGSDMHEHRLFGAPDRPLEPTRIGWPTTWAEVDGELTAEAVLAAVREGRTFVSESPSGPQLYNLGDGSEVRMRIAGADGQALLLIGPQGVVHAEGITGDDVESFVPSSRLPGDLPFVRPEIHAPGGAVKALGQAIWLR
ncbi:MAG TPA: CehA/McbA family metallohydrolase [Thermomicrobiales bacterium]|nr:CehA/McbA family metallohydrolase [Thermomicrobiales bacterium]